MRPFRKKISQRHAHSKKFSSFREKHCGVKFAETFKTRMVDMKCSTIQQDEIESIIYWTHFKIE